MNKLREKLSATCRKLNDVQLDYVRAREDVMSERRHRLERRIECPVCLLNSDISKAIRPIPCGHTVCSQCLETLLNYPLHDCPTCRREIESSMTIYT